MQVIQTAETAQGLTIRVSHGSRYINEFIRLRGAPDLLALGVFPNAKEITETMAAWSAVLPASLWPPCDRAHTTS